MNDYLKGFVDGFSKANEQNQKKSVSMNWKDIAEKIYKDVAELIEKDNERRKMM
ncbi:hypothetical protein V7112_08485 [Bacillus sp. JJ1566]|uniref:hypothetical protein n=1 Tax=Bacillus sp. JJ1566 TaxID=3122961 RepID=UPI002FFF9655